VRHQLHSTLFKEVEQGRPLLDADVTNILHVRLHPLQVLEVHVATQDRGKQRRVSSDAIMLMGERKVQQGATN
jgi:hypothetical protein